MPKYLDPKADLVFKKIFGNHPNILKSFLNAILPLDPDGQIVSLEYLPTELAPQIPAMKRTIVDVKCIDQKNRVFIVEMQMDWVPEFEQRMLFNAGAAYVKQLFKGEDYSSLCPVYGLGIIADNFEHQIKDWYHHYKIVNVQHPSKQLKGLELIFLELPKFKPTTQVEKRMQVLWLRFLSELDERTRYVDPELLEVPEIKEALSLSEEAAFTPGELESYSSYWDQVSTAKTLVNSKMRTAQAEGIAMGIAEGKAEGKAEGRAEGKAEGEAKKSMDIATNLLKLNIPVSVIAEATGLSIEELESLRKEYCFPLEKNQNQSR